MITTVVSEVTAGLSQVGSCKSSLNVNLFVKKPSSRFQNGVGGLLNLPMFLWAFIYWCACVHIKIIEL